MGFSRIFRIGVFILAGSFDRFFSSAAYGNGNGCLLANAYGNFILCGGDKGFLYGNLAGEGLVGILLAFLAVFGVGEVIDLSGKLNLPSAVANIGSLVVFALIILCLCKFSVWKKRK